MGWAAAVSAATAGSAAVGSATAVVAEEVEAKAVGLAAAVVVGSGVEEAGEAAVTVAAAAAKVRKSYALVVQLHASLPVCHVPTAGCKCCSPAYIQPGKWQSYRYPC